MRRLFIVIPAAALALLAASNASAQATNYPAISTGPVSTVQVTAPTPTFHIYEYQAELVSGAYALSNGWRLNVSPSRDGVVAQIDKQRPMRLVAMSPNRFVSRDGNVIMDFNRGPDQDQMAMSYIPASDGASVASERVTVTATLAQR